MDRGPPLDAWAALSHSCVARVGKIRLDTMSIRIAVPVTLTDGDVALIAGAFKVEANPHRLCLLPRVLREWVEVDLTEYASRDAFRASTPRRADRYQRVARRSKELLNAIDAVIEADDLGLIAGELGRADESIPMREKYGHFSQKLMDHRDFLNHLQTAVESAQNRLKKGPGQPRNTTVYLVLLDLAAIFKWVTGIKARREVDRIEGVETGPFYHFCEAIWPLVFRSGTDGLPAAMKNWASGHQRYHDTSALLANIDLRYPSWRVFDR